MTEYRPLSKFVSAGNDLPATSILYLRAREIQKIVLELHKITIAVIITIVVIIIIIIIRWNPDKNRGRSIKGRSALSATSRGYNAHSYRRVRYTCRRNTCDFYNACIYSTILIKTVDDIWIRGKNNECNNTLHGAQRRKTDDLASAANGLYLHILTVGT